MVCLPATADARDYSLGIMLRIRRHQLDLLYLRPVMYLPEPESVVEEVGILRHLKLHNRRGIE